MNRPCVILFLEGQPQHELFFIHGATLFTFRQTFRPRFLFLALWLGTLVHALTQTSFKFGVLFRAGSLGVDRLGGRE